MEEKMETDTREIDTKWLNKSKVTRKKNIINWKDDLVYQAHSVETPGFEPYVHRRYYNELVEALKMVVKTENPEHAADILAEHGIK
jgi:hypothetical protein